MKCSADKKCTGTQGPFFHFFTAAAAAAALSLSLSLSLSLFSLSLSLSLPFLSPSLSLFLSLSLPPSLSPSPSLSLSLSLPLSLPLPPSLSLSHSLFVNTKARRCQRRFAIFLLLWSCCDIKDGGCSSQQTGLAGASSFDDAHFFSHSVVVDRAEITADAFVDGKPWSARVSFASTLAILKVLAVNFLSSPLARKIITLASFFFVSTL